MSGWSTKDKVMAEDYGDDFPAMNNITVRGQLPSDMVPAPSKFSINKLFADSFLKNSEVKNSP